jgi:hypothetical protein
MKKIIYHTKNTHKLLLSTKNFCIDLIIHKKIELGILISNQRLLISLPFYEINIEYVSDRTIITKLSGFYISSTERVFNIINLKRNYFKSIKF